MQPLSPELHCRLECLLKSLLTVVPYHFEGRNLQVPPWYEQRLCVLESQQVDLLGSCRLNDFCIISPSSRKTQIHVRYAVREERYTAVILVQVPFMRNATSST